jgi:hypothetical protein
MMMHWEAVPSEVAEVYRDVSVTLRKSDFYVAGGTALALLEGHRISAGLDLFSPTFEEPEPLIGFLSASCNLDLEVTLTAPRTLYVALGSTQVSFFGYSHPLLSKTLAHGDDLLPLANRDDIAAMKLAALASRGSRKDFIDLWVLISRHRSLDDYLALYRKKYAARDIGHVVRSLAFFDDAEEEPPLHMLAEVEWDQVKADFGRWADTLLD